MAIKTVYIVRNLDNGQTLFNKVTGIWNNGSKPHLNGRKCWTFAVKKSGLGSPAIMDAREHLAKLGYTNIEFELARIDSVTKELVDFNPEPIALPASTLELPPAEVESTDDEIINLLSA